MAHPYKLSKKERPAKSAESGQEKPAAGPRLREKQSVSEERERVFDAFSPLGLSGGRRSTPLGLFEPLKHPDLDVLSGEGRPRKLAPVYCSTIGADFMHLPEPGAPPLDRRASRSARRERSINTKISRAADSRRSFSNKFLQGALPGHQAVFALEGVTALISASRLDPRWPRPKHGRGILNHGHEATADA